MFQRDLVVHDGNDTLNLTTDLFRSGRLGEVFQFWMAELARDLLRLGVYFRAAGLMLQIPGGADYQWPGQERHKDPGDEFTRDDQSEIVLDVLATCLERLDASHLLEQVPGGAEYQPSELCGEQAVYVERMAHEENGLLSVVARCLDELVVRPGMAEVDAMTTAPWWLRWRAERE